MSKEIRDYFDKTIYERTGGLESAIVDLKGLQASVSELNTLLGVDTRTTVQKQLNLKANKADLGTISSQDADSVAITGGNISNTGMQSSDITIRAGETTAFLEMGGSLDVNNNAVGNSAGAETDLLLFSIPAKTMTIVGSYLEITAFGTVAANANNKEIKLVLGTTTLLTTGSVAANSGSWQISAKIIYVTATSEKTSASIISDNSLIVNKAIYTASAENWETNLIIKCTGNGAGANDVVQEGLIIKWNKF